MQFAAPAEHYDRFMGRYTPSLAVALADTAGITAGMRGADQGVREIARVTRANRTGPFSLNARAWYARGTVRAAEPTAERHPA